MKRLPEKSPYGRLMDLNSRLMEAGWVRYAKEPWPLHKKGWTLNAVNLSVEKDTSEVEQALALRLTYQDAEKAIIATGDHPEHGELWGLGRSFPVFALKFSPAITFEDILMMLLKMTSIRSLTTAEKAQLN